MILRTRVLRTPHPTTPLVLAWVLLLFTGTVAAPGALAQSSSDPSDRVRNAGPDAPIELKLEAPTSVLEIYRALSRASSFDLVLDPDLDDRAITFVLPEMPPRQVLDVLTRTVGHFYQPLDESTFLVARDTPRARRHYEPLVIQIFVLEHLPVKDAMTVLRSLLDVKKLATVDQHNALLVRDTEEKVSAVGELLRRIDRPDGKLDRAAFEPLVVGPEDRLGHPEAVRVAENP